MTSPASVLMLFGRAGLSFAAIGPGHCAVLAHHRAAWAAAFFGVLSHSHPAFSPRCGILLAIPGWGCGMIMLGLISLLRMSVRLGVSGGRKGQQ